MRKNNGVTKMVIKNDEYAPLWVKLVGGFIAASVGCIIGGVLACYMIVWYIHDCEPNPACVVNRILN